MGEWIDLSSGNVLALRTCTFLKNKQKQRNLVFMGVEGTSQETLHQGFAAARNLRCRRC